MENRENPQNRDDTGNWKPVVSRDYGKPRFFIAHLGDASFRLSSQGSSSHAFVDLKYPCDRNLWPDLSITAAKTSMVGQLEMMMSYSHRINVPIGSMYGILTYIYHKINQF